MRDTKSRTVTVRLEPAQQRKLLILAEQAGHRGNMSAGLRWMLDQAKTGDHTGASHHDAGQGNQRPEGELRYG